MSQIRNQMKSMIRIRKNHSESTTLITVYSVSHKNLGKTLFELPVFSN